MGLKKEPKIKIDSKPRTLVAAKAKPQSASPRATSSSIKKAATSSKKKTSSKQKRRKTKKRKRTTQSVPRPQPLYSLSKVLAKITKTGVSTRPEVVKNVWNYVKEHNLQDGHVIVCDELMRTCFNTDFLHFFNLPGNITPHLTRIHDSADLFEGTSEEEDEDEDVPDTLPLPYIPQTGDTNVKFVLDNVLYCNKTKKLP